jgi:hypothetical protein
MAIVTFDTQKYHKKLRAAGVPDEQASAHVYALVEALRETGFPPEKSQTAGSSFSLLPPAATNATLQDFENRIVFKLSVLIITAAAVVVILLH